MAVWELQAGVSAPDISVFVSMSALSLRCSSGISFLLQPSESCLRGCIHRAIPGWWSVSVGVRGVRCYSAHCWGRCWKSGARWAPPWCWGSWLSCSASWAGCRPASASWPECSRVGRQSSAPRHAGAGSPPPPCSPGPGLSAASSAGTWSPPLECAPSHWPHFVGGCSACGRHDVFCPSCSKVQQRPKCWGRAGRLPPQWSRTALWSSHAGPPGVAGCDCPQSQLGMELG